MNSAWIAVLGGLAATLIAAQVTWAARQLIKHAQILAVVTTEIKAIPVLEEQLDDVSKQVIDVRIEQARVRAELALTSRGRRGGGTSP